MPEVFDLIDRIGKRGERLVTQTVGEAGLTPAQYLVLANLQEKAGRPLRELADALRCSPSTITGVVDTMEKKRLVAREPNPADRRSHLLRLTGKGRALRQSTPGLEEFYEGCTMGMSRQEFQRLRDLLMRLDQCMSAAGVGA
jgi:DNA-binding MarR family transcriptional regulator